MRPRMRGEHGFTLVETLVALAVLTLGLAALLQIFGAGFRGVRSSAADAAALHLAASQLARAGTEAALIEGQQQGTTPEGLEWTVTVEPYMPPDAGGVSPARAGLQAYWVTSSVRWKSSAFAAAQTLSLRTLKVAVP